MTEQRHPIDEALLSGYVDGELTQGDRQRVELHLEECATCRDTVESLRSIREVTMSTEFRVPEDTQWDEAPRGALSGFLNSVGWLVAIAWFVGMGVYVVWQIATDEESLRYEGLIGFALILAFVLIVLSALIDRLKTRKNDPYRKVEK